MKEINKNDIMDITLLSIDEARNVPNEILRIRCWWWLRSPGYNSRNAAYVNYDGDVNGFGFNVDYFNFGVRPALIIKNLESSHLQIGEKVACLNRTWFYVGGNLILSKCTIDFRPFNESTESGNDFSSSDIKQYLDDTLAKWLSE